MADTNQYRLKAVSLDSSVWSSVVADAVRLTPAANHLFMQQGGRINTAAHALASAAPIIECDVYKIDLITTPIQGTFQAVFESATDAGGAGASYVTFSATALMVPTQLRATKNQPATLSVRAILLSSDGSTSPITRGTTWASSLATSDDLYTVGASSVGGSAVNHITDQSIDWQYEIETDEGNSGKLYPTVPFTVTHQPQIQITTQDYAEATVDRVNGGEKVSTSAVDLVFKHLNGGANVSVSLSKGVIDAEAQGGKPAQVNLTINGVDADTDDSTFVVVS